MYKSENKAKSIMYQFAYKIMRRFGFNDPFPALKFCSLGCARVSLHLDKNPFLSYEPAPEYAPNQGA